MKENNVLGRNKLDLVPPNILLEYTQSNLHIQLKLFEVQLLTYKN